MKKNISTYLILSFLLITINLIAQQKQTFPESCSFSGKEQGFSEVEVYGFSSTEEANKIVQSILNVVGLKANFTIKVANVINATAVVDTNEVDDTKKRLILYNNLWIRNLSINDDWAAKFVLAHEIGHHLQGHTLSKKGSRPVQELEADDWAGFIMCRLGATLEEALSALQTVPEMPTAGTHPPRSARLVAATHGYERAGCTKVKSFTPKPISPKMGDKDGDGFNDNLDDCAGVFGTVLGCPDTDDDGVADKNDDCIYEKGEIKNKGCPPSDTDGDGVPDHLDQCPSVVGFKERQGCPYPDRDRDGIPDFQDECPNEAGIIIFKGCPDTDEDGIVDKLDECPNDAGEARFKGCPDSDADGILDKDDDCPNLVGTQQTKGCPDTDGDQIKDDEDFCPEHKGLPQYYGCPDMGNPKYNKNKRVSSVSEDLKMTNVCLVSAKQALTRKDYAASESNYLKTLYYTPFSWEAYYGLASAKTYLQEEKAARDYLNQSLYLYEKWATWDTGMLNSSSYVDLLALNAYVLMVEKEYNKMYQVADQMTRQFPTAYQSWLYRAIAQHYLKNKAAAKQDIQEASTLNPSDEYTKIWKRKIE